MGGRDENTTSVEATSVTPAWWDDLVDDNSFPLALKAKLRNGLEERLRDLKKLIYSQDDSAHDKFKSRPSTKSTPTITDIKSLASADGRVNSKLPNSDRWPFISAAVTSWYVTLQQATARTISPASDVDINSLYVVGACFAHPLPSVGDLLSLPDGEFSLAFESLVRFAPDQHLPFSRSLYMDVITQFAAEAAGVSAWTLEDFLVGPSASNDDTSAADFAPALGLIKFRRSLTSFKRNTLHLIGPDTTSALQALCDPGFIFTREQLIHIEGLAKDWKFEDLFLKLLILRAIGPYEAERSFIRERYHKIVASRLPAARARMVGSIVGLDIKSRSIKPRSTDYIPRLIWLYYRIHGAMISGQTRVLTDAIIDTYCLDPALIGFLDWEKIYEVFRTNTGPVDARTTFITFLMNHDAVRRKFPYVALSMGKGALISDLTSLIDARRRTDAISPLLSQLRTLPRAAGEALTLALLDRAIMERIASALPHSRRLPRQRSRTDSSQVSVVRLEAIRAAQDRALIRSDDANAMFEQEIAHLRMQYFQGRMRSGRVRIPWDEIELEIKDIASSNLGALKALASRSDRQESAALLLPRFSRFVADRIVEHILYGSKAGIDQALSNNLRHGIIVPRFLRAFDDALQTCFPNRRSLPAWDSSTLFQTFGKSGPSLLEFREFVSDSLKAFVDERLTLTVGSEFDGILRERIAHRIAQDVEKGSRALSYRLERSVVSVARRELSSYLLIAGRSLSDGVRKTLVSALRALRAEVRSYASPSMGGFLDCLESNLHEACDEARQWIGITKSGHAIPFKFSEVVKLQLFSTSLSAWDQLKVTTRCLRPDDTKAIDEPDMAISGKYLDLFQEVIHNLVSNAFEHSGEVLKTKVDLELVIYKGKFVIRCYNSIAPAKLAGVIQDHRETVALARAIRGDQARRDKSSGFQKIRHAYDKAFNRQPVINIPLVSASGRGFLVEITSEHPGDLVEL